MEQYTKVQDQKLLIWKG